MNLLPSLRLQASRSIVPNQASAPSRRIFLATVAIGLAGTQINAPIGLAAPPATATGEAVLLQPRLEQDLFRVRMEMDIKGNVNLMNNALLARTPGAKSKQQLPITAKIALDYEERFLRPVNADAESPIIAIERSYHAASGVSRLSRNEQSTQLRQPLGMVVARRDQLPEAIYSPDDYLTHDELDLLRTPVASVSIDRMMPSRAIAPGQSVPVDSSELAAAFNLTAVADSDVEIELVSNGAEDAKLQLKGKIEGSVAGVPTQLRVLGKLTFDHTVRTVTWAAIAIHETREIGIAEPGFDVTATIRMIRKPLVAVQTLPAQPIAIDFESPIPAERMLMAIDCEKIGVSALLDRRWRVMQDGAGQAILRMIENEESIAQCNLRSLPQLGEGQQMSLEAFETDVRQTLGNRLVDILQADERMAESGLRMLQVNATGQVEGIPIQWIMMHFSDEAGRRVQATFTMDGDGATKLAGSDVQLAATIRLSGELLGQKGNEGEGTQSASENSLTKNAGSASSTQQRLELDPDSSRGSSQLGSASIRSASDLPKTKR